MAAEGDKIVGFTGAERKSKRTAYMLKGYVEPSYRRRGIMRQLEGKLAEILRESGVSTIDLKVDSHNREGKSTWVALGYETVHETMRKRI